MAQPCAYTPSSTNSERLTTALLITREGFVCLCACTEPAGTAIGAVRVERRWTKVAEKYFESHTLAEKIKTKHPALVQSVVKRLVSPWKARK